MKGIFLESFEPWSPPFRSTQAQLLELMRSSLDPIDELESKLFDRVVCKTDDIQSRMHALPLPDAEALQRIGSLSTGERSALYAQSINPWVESACRDVSQDEEAMIHVTCTGYLAPNPIQLALSALSRNRVPTLNLYHMGCYAFFPALRTAKHWIYSGEVRSTTVLLSELCTLHFSNRSRTPEQWVIQSLFADGALKLKVTSKPTSKRVLRLLNVREERIPESHHMMRWHVSEQGFRMSLDRGVPRAIERYVRDFITRMTGDHSSAQETTLFAIHPGGPSILRAVTSTLKLREHQAFHSHQIFKSRGNMSSVTVPTILGEILNDSNVNAGQEILALAFGPGLTIFGARFILEESPS